MNWLTSTDDRWLNRRPIKSIPLSTDPCVELELVPLPTPLKEGSTFRKPAPKRHQSALRDWLPCWFGGLDQAAKDEA